MSQVNITVNYEEVVALLSKERNEAFGYLMEKILNAFLLAESEEQVGAAPGKGANIIFKEISLRRPRKKSRSGYKVNFGRCLLQRT
ncbi:MAG TPA: hypothetical protein VN381_17065 [Anaerovoracaceae bacterium]|nr:hypothetical protein [Anaerovoracaceae bacterium]